MDTAVIQFIKKIIIYIIFDSFLLNFDYLGFSVLLYESYLRKCGNIDLSINVLAVSFKVSTLQRTPTPCEIKVN